MCKEDRSKELPVAYRTLKSVLVKRGPLCTEHIYCPGVCLSFETSLKIVNDFCIKDSV